MIRLLLAFVAICAASTALAQYPNRPIRFVMAYPPAGSSDPASPVEAPTATGETGPGAKLDL